MDMIFGTGKHVYNYLDNDNTQKIMPSVLKKIKSYTKISKSLGKLVNSKKYSYQTGFFLVILTFIENSIKKYFVQR